MLSRCFLCSACKCNCTILLLRKIGLAGDTDVAIDIEVAVGILVAFDSANQALTCHSTSEPPVVAANRQPSASRAFHEFWVKQ